jgi:nucleoside-diphosphate-sugar epimerase
MPLHEMVGEFARAVGAPPPRGRIPHAAGWAIGCGAEIIWGLARREPPFSRRSLSFFEADNSYDTTAARRDLGFAPRFDLVAGLHCTLEHMMQRAAA